MTTNQTSGRRGLVWAIVGGLVLIAGIVAIVVSSLLAQSAPAPTESAAPQPTASPSTGEPPAGDVVDASVIDHGWLPEPITTDREVYIRAALEAAATFDTQKSTRKEWLGYLDSWFTPDTRYAEADRADRLRAAQLELRQGVVLPQEEWDSLANEDGRVVATATGEPVYVPVTDDASGDMSIGTSDVTLTFTRSDGSGGETSYEEQVRVSVQVLCGPGSVPTPDSAQRAGDCKVVRYFTEPLEP
ncbi:hypothetical protein JNB63_19420 [Microbacterium trichothecenolyticum]|uniref:Uncharacterized protein n=1 Tax=Microbacterium ureisolvens TaxID=2781186 RepID=A0ABS7I5G2_9MICO|nr:MULTISPECIES: hypothetical protein [Microbacterium]MBW9111886.1 hypothetical protein [Microbacterium ureisolvens]MBW9122267.1 hypothetical protein [Microbacterium trichothecenolyticum]